MDKSKELPYDPNPLFAVAVTKNGDVIDHVAFDPKYGPESQSQIDWHRKQGTPGAEDWEVGKPFVFKKAGKNK